MFDFILKKTYILNKNYPYLQYAFALVFPIFFIFLGAIFLFKPHWMLESTCYFEKKIGADWIPSEKTYTIYKNIGVILIAFGCVLFGYIWAAR